MKARAAPLGRRFAAYSIANGLAFVAAWMQRLALGWVVWEASHSALWLGILAFADLGPALIFGPLGGVVADRGRPLRLIRQAQSAVLATSLATGVAVWLGAPLIPLVVLAALGGAANALADAARAAVVAMLVVPARAPAAVALTAVFINLARFVGPAVGGVVAVVAGIVPVFFAAAILALPLVVFASVAPVEARAEQGAQHWLRELGGGIGYAARHRAIGLALLNFLLSSLLARAAYELLPGIASGLFGRGIVGLSAMTTALGIGAVVAGLLAMRVRDSGGAARAGFAGSLLGGGAVVVLALAQTFEAALVAVALVGVFVSAGAIAAQILVQLEASLNMRARVLSLWAMIIRTGPALGALAIGAMVDWLGFRPPLAAAGLAAMLSAAVCWWLFSRRPIAPQPDAAG